MSIERSPAQPGQPQQQPDPADQSGHVVGASVGDAQAKPSATAGSESSAESSAANSEDGAADDAFKPLTREEAQALRPSLLVLSPWRALVAQALAGVVCALLAWAVLGPVAAWSALYGAVVVVVPGAVMARGLRRQAGLDAGAAMVQFMVWELVKMVLAVALLLAAVKLVPGLSWVVLVITLVVCLKVNWLMLLRQRPVVNKIQAIQEKRD